MDSEGKRVQKIEIFYRFIGNIDQAVDTILFNCVKRTRVYRTVKK